MSTSVTNSIRSLSSSVAIPFSVINISLSGKGRYNYIPDIGFVGTIFVNSQANIMSNIIRNLKIKIKYENMTDEMILGSYETQLTSEGCEIYLGTLQYGQEKTIVLKLQNSENCAKCQHESI